MKRHTTVARDTDTDARLELIKHLAEQVATAPVHSRRRHTLKTAIRVEADAYRKSLDSEQAAATHGAESRPAGRARIAKHTTNGGA
jgi:GAF domain-containing protein